MNNTYTFRDKVGILILSFLIVICYLYFNIMNIVSSYRNINLINHYGEFSFNGHFVMFFISWISVLGLVYYSLKGLFKNYKLRKRNFFLFLSLIIFIIYSILTYPLYIFPISSFSWIFINFFGMFYLLFFIAMMDWNH